VKNKTELVNDLSLINSLLTVTLFSYGSNQDSNYCFQDNVTSYAKWSSSSRKVWQESVQQELAPCL